jgi:ribosomal protein S3
MQLVNEACERARKTYGCLGVQIWIARRWPQLRNYNGDEPIEAGAMAD